VNGEHAKLLLHYCISEYCYIGKPAYLSMPKFLAGRHYNEEEIIRHLKNKYRILAGPKWQQVCNWSNPEKTGRSCEGADSSWLNELKSLLNPDLTWFPQLLQFVVQQDIISVDCNPNFDAWAASWRLRSCRLIRLGRWKCIELFYGFF
jgi:hypothetical protein